MNIVFMGTPEFAVPALLKLNEKYGVVAVFTQPDKPKGRGKKIAFSPVKEAAISNCIPVLQPEKIKNDVAIINHLKSLNIDFIVVAAYGQILSQEILDIPKYGCINIHASLLPKYRGAAPINWAIINGESKSGNTTMLMNKGLDTGDMLLSSSFEITQDMNAGELHDLLMENGAELIIETIEKFTLNKLVPTKQIDDLSCYAPMLNKQIALIDWKKSNKEICNLVRGLNPSPVAYTKYNGMNMKIYKAIISSEKPLGTPGTIISVDKTGIDVCTGDGVIKVINIQFPGSKAMDVREYIKGNHIDKEVVLGL